MNYYVCVLIKWVTILSLFLTAVFVVLASLLGPLAVLVTGVYLVLGIFGLSPYMIVVVFVIALELWSIMYHGIKAELQLLQEVGPKRLLWVSNVAENGVRGLLAPRAMAKGVLVIGWDATGPWLSEMAQLYGLPTQFFGQSIEEGVLVMGSVLYSKVVQSTSLVLLSELSWLALLWGGVVLSLKMSSRYYSAAVRFSAKLLLVLIVLTQLTPENISHGVMAILRFVVSLQKVFTRETPFFEWLQWRFVNAVVVLVARMESVNWEIQNKQSEYLLGERRKAIAHFRSFVFQGVKLVNDLALPHFIRRGFASSYSKEALEATNELMRQIGWPINESLEEPVVNEITEPFKDWILCGSSFKQGIHNLKVHTDESLDSLRIAGLAYRRTEEYASEKNELESTSRYFRSPRFDYPDLEVDDVWFLVKDIFAMSKFTSFNHIIQMWEKKYSLGSFMSKPGSNGKRKYPRRDFISYVGGYGPFKRLWARTFYYATAFVPVSSVSVKGETLAPKKWMNDKVRTVVGTPLGHYIFSTFFNYGPNHSFAWETTPIKVGMPLNGYWMSWLFSRHSRCQIHVEGDFTAFDSTLDGPVSDMIKMIRKKGYEFHKDKNRIGDLIDICYDQVTNQLLNTTSNGNIYRKGAGLTTGHSSTSMDNSVGLVTLYMMAWKELTGLSAREFVHFNELSCYGDDHLLSILQSKPQSWSPKNIEKVMSKWGVVNNIEVKKLTDCEFLSKRTRRANAFDLSELSRAGIKNVKQIVWHNKDKLVGKLTAPVKTLNPTYRLTRYLSYITLTAHHEDIYNGLVRVISNSKTMQSIIKNNKLVVPTYEKVLRDWYKPTSSIDHSDVADFESEFVNTGKMVQVGAVTPFDQFLGVISMLPDFLSPSAFNFGYMRLLQSKMKPRLAWVMDLVCIQNGAFTPGHARSLMQRTPYRWLETNDFIIGASGANNTELLVRHWLYVAYMLWRPKRSSFQVFSFIAGRISSVQFAFNGVMHSESRSNDFSLDLVFLAACLSFINVPDWLSGFERLQLPDLNSWVDLVLHFCMVFIWQSVPANYKEVVPALNACYREKAPLLVSAPTGTGKSTAFIAFLYHNFGHKYTDIVVLEPRHILAKGLATYMETDYGLPVTAGTAGVYYDSRKKVKYMTHQFLMGHLELLSCPTALFIIDEAHVAEPFVMATIELLSSLNKCFVMVTATPSPSNLKKSFIKVALELPQLWKVDVTERRAPSDIVDWRSTLNWYASSVNGMLSSMAPYEKVLVMVGTPEQGESMLNSSPIGGVVLSSKHPVPVSWDSRVYFATSVADVGLTIPNLTYVLTLDAQHEDRWVQSTESTMSQRRGRVGRTNNGHFVIFKHNVTLPTPSTTLTTVKNFSTLAGSGFPVGVLRDISESTVAEMVGMDTAGMSEAEIDSHFRAISVMINNFVPASVMAENGAVSVDTTKGRGQMLFETGTGNISSSFLGEANVFESRFLPYIRQFAHALQTRTPFYAANEMSAIAGPVVDTMNLVRSLLHDPAEGQTDLLNPKNRQPTGSLSNLYEIKRIKDLLDDIEKMA